MSRPNQPGPTRVIPHDDYLRAGRIRSISCSGHALVRSRLRFGLSFDQPATEAKFELCEQARTHLLAGRWSHDEPWWTRKHPLRKRRSERKEARWCWDERRERCFLLVYDRSWRIVTCLRRRRWAAPLAVLALGRRRPLPAVVRLSPDGTHGLLRVGAFLPEITLNRKPRYGALLCARLDPQIDLLALDFAGAADMVDDDDLLELFSVANRRLSPRGQIVVLGLQIPDTLLPVLRGRFGLRPLTTDEAMAGETLRLHRGRSSATPWRRYLP